MIYLGVQCMYFRAKPLQNQCILELVHYTKQTVYLESYFDLNTLKMIVKIKFVVNFVKLDLIRTFNSNNTLHQLMGNETSLAQKRQIEQSFYTFLEIVYLEVIKELKKQCILEIFVPKPKQCICENSVPWGRVPWGLAVIRRIPISIFISILPVMQISSFCQMMLKKLKMKNMVHYSKLPPNYRSNLQ